MGPAFYVMAILGCGEADAPCEPIAMVDARYASADACAAATAEAVARHHALAYPVVIAQCEPDEGALSRRIMPSQIKLPEPDPQPNDRRAPVSRQRPARG